jgi:hypothetical protein
VRWKVAIGAALDDPGFDSPALVYWRRIAKSARPHRISDAVRKIVAGTGVLKGRRRRAVDSTVLADAVVILSFAVDQDCDLGERVEDGVADAD